MPLAGKTAAVAMPWFAYALLFGGMSIVGVYVALAKPLAAALPVFLLAGLRFLIAAVAMIPWLRVEFTDAPLTPALWRLLILQSFLGNFLFSICMLYGVSLTSATAAGVILAMIPAVTALFGAIWLSEPMRRTTWWAIALAVLGITVLQLGRDAAVISPKAASDVLLGNFLIAITVCCEAAYVVLGKKLTARLSAKRISAIINLIGMALMAPLALWQGWGFDFASVTPSTWGLLLFYALAASMITTWMWLTGLKTVPANQAGVFAIAMPLAASIVGVAYLGETFTWAHAVALVCAVAGVVLVTRIRP